MEGGYKLRQMKGMKKTRQGGQWEWRYATMRKEGRWDTRKEER